MHSDESFTPDTIDEQVDQFSSLAQRDSLLPSARMVQRLHALYEADMYATERVWQRLEQHITEHNSDVQLNSGKLEVLNELHEERFQPMQQALHSPGRTEPSRLALVAAVIFTALLVSSMLWVLHISRSSQHPSTAAVVPPSPHGLYISTLDEVSRLDSQTRKVIWHTPMPVKDTSHFAPTPTVIGDTVYVTPNVSSSSVTLAALDARTGALRWSRSFKGSVASPYMADGLLYINTLFNTIIYALNPADGNIQATYKPIQGSWNTPTVVNGVLYYTSGANLYAVKLPDKQVLWHQQVSQNQLLESLSVRNGMVYVQALVSGTSSKDSSGLVYEFNAHTGQKLWQSPLIARGVRTLTITNERIYASSFIDGLFAFDTRTHRLAWHRQIDTYDIVAGSDIVYIGFSPGNVDHEDIAALRSVDGKTLWQRKITGGLSVLGLQDGVFYLIDWGGTKGGNGIVYALKASDGSVLWHMDTNATFGQWNMTVA